MWSLHACPHRLVTVHPGFHPQKYYLNSKLGDLSMPAFSLVFFHFSYTGYLCFRRSLNSLMSLVPDKENAFLPLIIQFIFKHLLSLLKLTYVHQSKSVSLFHCSLHFKYKIF
jgi:hypothetical protein